ncbi:MAG: hypothetical protein IPL42_17475 [Saprospiraceae bacterium]|nr:hypothetical protein [Saprospiraceae bacterium]
MFRTKERAKIIHQPSTLEIFYSLSCMPSYSKLLLDQCPDKPYSDFLVWLIEQEFYKDRAEKIAIKKISADFMTNPIKVTKWIKEIYEQIFELNSDKPELFQKKGVKVCLYMSHHDSSCHINTSLPTLPREFETISFPFVKGKLGTDHFWVKKVQHEIVEDIVEIFIWLEGRTLNKYREFALAKALFEDKIHFMDVFHMQEYEIDKELKMIYRN